jgi:serine protease Do
MLQLKEKGKVTRGWLGVYPQDLDANLAKGLGVEPASGAYVSSVVQDSPADKAGIQEGDIITDVDGKAVKRANDLYTIVAELPVGKTVAMKIIRDKKPQTVSVKIAERPKDGEMLANAENDAGGGWLGLTVADITDEIAKDLRLRPGETGVIITGVKPRSSAAQVGLAKGDIIRKIDGQVIRSVKDFNEIAKTKKTSYAFIVRRGVFTLALTVTTEKPEKEKDKDR